VVLYGSLTLRKEHGLRVLWRMFGPRRIEVTGGWEKLHNEDLHNFFCLPGIINKVKEEEFDGEVRSYGAEKGRTQGFSWKSRKGGSVILKLI
jgi:hypothetical protein